MVEYEEKKVVEEVLVSCKAGIEKILAELNKISTAPKGVYTQPKETQREEAIKKVIELLVTVREDFKNCLQQISPSQPVKDQEHESQAGKGMR